LSIDDARSKIKGRRTDYSEPGRDQSRQRRSVAQEEYEVTGGDMTDMATGAERADFNAAEMAALAHLYNAEVSRSTAWRLRFDNTTNWSVVTTGIAFSASFSSQSASPLPLVLVGLLVVFFLLIEARRFRYFDIWRLRARILETRFFAPLLRGEKKLLGDGWNERLAHDYDDPIHRTSFALAVGRRLRNNYAWIFIIQATAYFGKLAIHPTQLKSLAELWERAAIGPVPGKAVVALGILFHASWVCFVAVTYYLEQQERAHAHDRH
jgi:uncharacterized membrane protein